MKKINFRQPKFVLPLILLPFLVLGFFVIGTFKSKGSNKQMTLEDSIKLIREKGLNPDMPNVSNDISKGVTKDKFGAYTDAYKNQRDYSALNSVDNIKTDPNTGNISTYSQADIVRLQANQRMDSMRKTMEKSRAIIEQRINGFSNGKNQNKNSQYPTYPGTDNQSREILEALKNRSQNLYGDANNPYSNNGNKPVGGTYEDQMKFFKEQMKMVDSMQKSNRQVVSTDLKNTPEYKKPEARNFDPQKDSGFKPLHVLPAEASLAPGQGFNTVRKFKAEESIKAIIDEEKKVTAGARVRIKLLQDILVGEHIIPAGSFIYGIVSGFQTQRINITITSITENGIPLQVNLNVYDMDGYLGLYVPTSNFREFTKEVGTQSTSGMSQLQTTNGTTDIQSSLISKLFQSSTNTVGKLIAQNKVALKADYIIYLKENKTTTKF